MAKDRKTLDRNMGAAVANLNDQLAKQSALADSRFSTTVKNIRAARIAAAKDVQNARKYFTTEIVALTSKIKQQETRLRGDIQVVSAMVISDKANQIRINGKVKAERNKIVKIANARHSSNVRARGMLRKLMDQNKAAAQEEVAALAKSSYAALAKTRHRQAGYVRSFAKDLTKATKKLHITLNKASAHSDTLDGKIDNLVQDDGNTVDTGAAFYAQRSCAGIKSQIQSMTKTQSSKFGKFGYDNKKNLHTAASRKVVTAAKAPKDGPYFITTYTPGKRYQRTQVWCDMKNGATYKFIANSNKKTYPLGKQGSNSCSALGMRVWSTFAAKAQATAVAHVKNHLKENANTNKALLDFLNIRSATTSTTSYICVPASVVNAVKANHFATSGRAANKYQVSRISNAEVGKYVITYTVADKAGNPTPKS